jgi:hypothetical protein
LTDAAKAQPSPVTVPPPAFKVLVTVLKFIAQILVAFASAMNKVL